MSHGTAPPKQPASGPLTEGERQHAAALILVHDHIGRNYRPGQRLPVVKGACSAAAQAMALRLGLPMLHVAAALKVLNSSGEIHLGAGIHGPRVLGPHDLHPDDVAFDTAVRDHIASGHHHFGQALPSGLLGVEFGLESDQVDRAFRHLMRDALVRHNPRGHYGPGYYVTLGTTSRSPAMTPQPLSAARP
ncbi:hypothetical protein ACFWWA_17550 [Streptomyces goshikiensis]|uniref:hypothetical protein n=1 Tax=Streptomyces goshikiensis TaxID=1942 RepID=UPI003658AB5E